MSAIAELTTLPGRNLDDYPTPQSVLDFMTEQGGYPNEVERAAAEREYKLSALFGGKSLVSRRDSEGIHIQFVGTLGDLVEWRDGLSESERELIGSISLPAPLEVYVEEWREMSRPVRRGFIRRVLERLFGE